jgi:hypothetical protein
MAMAATAGHEYLRQPLELSIEHLWWHLIQRGGIGPAGATFSSLTLALASDGQCIEPHWPYSPIIPTPAPNPIPTPAYVAAGSTSRPAALDTIRAELSAGRPVVFGFRMNDEFVIGSDPIDASASDFSDNGLHAVVAVAYDEGARLVTIRNSWGTGWGSAGYGRLTYNFINRRSTRLLAINL